MLFYLLLSFIFGQNNYSPEQLDPNNYFCKSNTKMKILKISEMEFVFYGTEGGILRTYDAGETWYQNYSGLQDSDDVIKLIFSINEIIGITNTGKVITSKDKGDYWKIKQISSDFSGLTKIEDNLFASTKSDSIYISTDNGLNWTGHKISLDKILNITSQNGKLILITLNTIYVLNTDLTTYKYLQVPFYDRIYDKFDKLYLSDSFSVTIMNDDFELEKYQIFDTPRVFSIYPNDVDSMTIFSTINNMNQMPFYQQSTFNFKTNENVIISEFKSMNLLHKSNDLLEFQILDIEKTGDDFLFSSYFKTIFKIKENKKWNIISYSQRESFTTNINSLDEYQVTVFNRSYLLSTYDRGNTFKLSSSPTYTRKMFERTDTISPVIFSSYYLNPNRSFIFFNNQGIINFNSITSNYNFVGITNDNFNTIELLNIDFEGPFQSINTKFRFLGEHNGDLYMQRSFESIGKDKIFHTYLYKLNTESLKLDTVYIFKDSLESINVYFDNNKIWVSGCNAISNNNIKLYLSNDNGKTFELKQNFELVKKHSILIPGYSYPIRNMNNDLIVYSDNQIMKINENDFSYTTTTFNLTLSPISYFNISGNKFEENIYSINKVLEGVSLDTVYISKISIQNNGLVFENLYKYNIKETNSFIPRFVSNSKDIIFTKGKNTQYYFPIEPERLAYYTSVETTENRNYLWTNPPYPQPSNNQVKVEVYWDSDLPFTSDDVEIYDLTGIKRNTNGQISVIKENNWKGNIIWDASSQIPGIYIMKITHGTETRTRKIIITK